MATAEAHSDATVFALHQAVQQTQWQNLKSIERDAERRIDTGDRAIQIDPVPAAQLAGLGMSFDADVSEMQ